MLISFYFVGVSIQANGTDIGEMKVFRGAKKSADIGRVISFDGETEMDVWPDDECNQYIGTDQSIFPPYLKLEDGIWAFEPSNFTYDICRKMYKVFTQF